MQCINGFHLCRFISRVQAETDTDDKAEEYCDENNRSVHNERHTQAGHDNGDDLQNDEGATDSDGATEHTKYDGLDEEL